MKRFTGHKEAWGEFVDVKIIAAALLQREVEKMPPGRVWVSGVCDPYQPLEKTYELTKKCLEILVRHDWPITIQTKSPLVLRDVNLLRETDKVEVGLSVTTGDEGVRQLFEPSAPSIKERIKALEGLRLAGIRCLGLFPNGIMFATCLFGGRLYLIVIED
jgi:DNA repair photolyase